MSLEGLPCSSKGKESACNAEDQGSIPGSGKSSGEENGSPLQYSCLENSMDREASRGHKESGTTERLTVIRRGFPGGTGGNELTCQIRER